MERLSEYLAMGGYAGFIWPAYGLVVVVLVGLFVVSRRFLRSNEAELAAAEAEEGALPHRVRRPGGERIPGEA